MFVEAWVGPGGEGCSSQGAGLPGGEPELVNSAVAVSAAPRIYYSMRSKEVPSASQQFTDGRAPLAARYINIVLDGKMVLERSQSGIFKMKGPKPMTIVIKLGESHTVLGAISATTDVCPGTSSIVNEVTHEPLLSTLSHIVETVVSLKKDGHKVVLVSSGAIGVALGERKMEKRPKHLPAVQVHTTLDI
jgi:hypothetical protein